MCRRIHFFPISLGMKCSSKGKTDRVSDSHFFLSWSLQALFVHLMNVESWKCCLLQQHRMVVNIVRNGSNNSNISKAVKMYPSWSSLLYCPRSVYCSRWKNRNRSRSGRILVSRKWSPLFISSHMEKSKKCVQYLAWIFTNLTKTEWNQRSICQCEEQKWIVKPQLNSHANPTTMDNGDKTYTDYEKRLLLKTKNPSPSSISAFISFILLLFIIISFIKGEFHLVILHVWTAR